MPTSTHALPMSSSNPLTRLLAVCSLTIVRNVNLSTWFTIYCYAILKVDKVSRASCFIVPSSSFSPGHQYPILELELYIICLSTIYYVLYNFKIIQFNFLVHIHYWYFKTFVSGQTACSVLTSITFVPRIFTPEACHNGKVSTLFEGPGRLPSSSSQFLFKITGNIHSSLS